jgi:[acyl-carrier-protein] S-malonyltransferase
MGKTAVIFPGQGAQAVGMGREIAERFSTARSTYEEANDLLGFDLAALCFEGPAERLDATDLSQPAIFATSVAIWRAMEEAGLAGEITVAASAGLSLGEYTALWLTGSMSFESGLRLVRRRGELMQAASEATPSGMVSVIGLDETQVVEVCQEAAAGEVLGPANFNCPGQIVISGTQAACQRAVALIEQKGGRGVALRVAGAFHSALMGPAAEGLRANLSETIVNPPRLPVVSNVTAEYHRDPDSIRDLLQRQVCEPVRWQASIERLISDGVDEFVEVGPGRVLSGLMRKIDRSVRVTNYSTLETFERTAAV